MEQPQNQGAGLTYREAVPLRLQPLDPETAPTTLQQLNARNEMLLRVCVAGHDHLEIEERDEFSAELARLDLKMDLIIACLQLLVAGDGSLPAPVPVTLTPKSVSWPVAAGTLLPDTVAAATRPETPLPVLAEIFISAVMPMPLALRGTLTRDHAEEPVWAVVFDPPGEHLTQLLEKLIFRYHRHAVAKGVD